MFYTEVICPSLTLENADVIYNTDFVLNYASRVLGFVIGYKVNTLVTFSCGYSYYIEGSRSAICQTSGEWSQPVPKCIHTSNENESLFSMSISFLQIFKDISPFFGPVIPLFQTSGDPYSSGFQSQNG